jgi:hypothetical protein
MVANNAAASNIPIARFAFEWIVGLLVELIGEFLPRQSFLCQFSIFFVPPARNSDRVPTSVNLQICRNDPAKFARDQGGERGFARSLAFGKLKNCLAGVMNNC